MSKADAQSFIERMDRDESLQRAATAALGQQGDAPMKSLIALGAQHGMTFDAEELIVAWDGRSQSTGSAELGDAELDRVAGGLGSVGSFLSQVQSYFEAYNQANKAKSNIASTHNKTADAIVQNIRG